MQKNVLIRKTVLILALVFTTIGLNAQQQALYSQYMLNKYIINPGVTGTTNHFIASTNFRYQWLGFTDAPRTYALTVHGPMSSGKFGIGGSIYNDVTGPTSKTGIYLSFAKQIQLTSNQKLSFGLSGGLLQFKIDGTKLTLTDPGDQVLTNQRLSTAIPDFGFGAYWYEEGKFYLGVSTPQFIQSKISFTENNTQSLSSLTIHYFLNGGYTFHLNSNFDIEPSVLLKFAAPVDMQLDIGTRMIFKENVWLGAVYRTQDAISVLIGYTTSDDKLSFGYSYDFTQSNVRNFSTGSHEIMLSVKFGKKHAYQSRGKSKKSVFERLRDEKESYTPKTPKSKPAVDPEIEKLKKELKELQKKDKTNRDKLRSLKSEASSQGLDSADSADFAKRDQYLKVLQELKSIYSRKTEVERLLKK